MRTLAKLSVVQFFFIEAQEIAFDETTAFIGPNGSGKSSLLDAIQIVLVGGRQRYLALNAQATETRSKRSLKDYCLGLTHREGEIENRKRDVANTYLALTWKHPDGSHPITVGVHLNADAQEARVKTRGFIYDGYDIPIAAMLERDKDGAELPIKWETFVVEQHRHAKSLDLNFSTHDNTLDFVREYLHRLQDRKAHISPEKYLGALKDSLKLNKEAQDIDAFVRHHLIEPDHIDLEDCKKQIRHFDQLRTLMAEIEAKIERLETVDVGFGEVAEQYARIACYDALSVKYEVERTEGAIASSQRERAEYDRQVFELRRALEQAKHDLTDADAERDNLVRIIAASPDAARYSAVQERIRDLRAQGEQVSAEIVTSINELGIALGSVPSDLPIVKSSDMVESRRALIAMRSASDFGSVQRGLDVVRATLAAAYSEAEAARRANDEKLAAIRGEREDLSGRLRRVRQGGSDLRVAGRLVELLARQGIAARPVCDSLRITDTHWQAAIEAYLGRNRESLIVAEQEEERAIAIQRGESDAAYGVKLLIAQKLPAADTLARYDVAWLIDADDDLAKRYVCRLLAGMKRVSTIDELRRFPRALTADLMVSSGYAVSKLRPVPLMIGVPRDGSTVQTLERALEKCDRDAVELGLLNEGYSTCCRQVAVFAAETFSRRFADAIQRHRALTAAIAREEIGLTDAAGEGAKLLALQERALARVQEVRALISDFDRRVAVVNERLQNVCVQLDEHKASLQAVEQRHLAALQDPSFRQDLSDRVEGDLRAAVDLTERIRLCSQRADRNRKDAQPAAYRLIEAARDYFRGENQEIPALDHGEWRETGKRISTELGRLRGTSLIQHKARVEEAKAKATESYQRDVVMKLGDRVKKMEKHILDLNQVLRKCPSFSNGERYRFEGRPKTEMRPLLESITNPSAGDSNPFDGPEVQGIIEALIGEGELVGRKDDVFDYRSFFQFDVVMVDRDGKDIGRLSSRMGAGSGAEQRIPIFVIAGAALATVYRLDVANPTSGFGLMLLDEAFDKLDTQNTAAVADFLTSIGLQLVLALPDGAGSNVAAFCRTQYDISRTAANTMIFERVINHSPAHQLLTSDMPRRHPELIEQLAAEIEQAG